MVLARELALPYCDGGAPAASLQLIHRGAALELHDPTSGARLRVDFSAEDWKRFRAGGSGPNPLRRAIGAGPRDVVDATAGLGRDAVHLAALGYRVTAIEREPVVSALVRDGLARARAQGAIMADNPGWRTGDAGAILPTLDPRPATVYLDPMFPPKRKRSAAVRKEMQLLRELAADATDVAELLAVARACAMDRVVVKRPLAAAPIAAGRRAYYSGRLVRYDVYASSNER
jgi:16S rRNA (guanine1516-N2)-methyltransferase